MDLNEKSINRINCAIQGLCDKARSENMPTPFRVSFLDPTNNNKKLWESEVRLNEETKEFSWRRDYPDFTNEHVRMELIGANGLILIEKLNIAEDKNTTTEAPANTRTLEAGAAA